jgi:hypothetical protein
MIRAALALSVLLATPALPRPALAQTYDFTPAPGGGTVGLAQTQANLNQMQVQLQASQLQAMQRQTTLGPQTSDPGVQAQAMIRRQQIQQQIDQNTALQQQMLSPYADPRAVGERLRQSGAEIQQLQAPAVPQPVR